MARSARTYPTMWSLVQSYRKYDPAARGSLEIILLYPGIKALLFHRLAHALFLLKIPFFPRMIGEFSRFLTGIEIHPGAKVGKDVIFDHGMGIVVGETAEIGDNVILYQGVTLGGVSTERTKRHPTLESHVVVGAGAKVLGNIRVGAGSRIGANSVVVADVPPHSTVVGIPGKVFHRGIEKGHELQHDEINAPFLGEGI